jgi:DNA-binding MarR family transcriptional regulator
MSSESDDSIAQFIAGWRRERPDLDPSPLGIMGRTSRVTAHLLRRAEGWLAPLGLTWETFSVIAALRRAGEPYELNPTDLQRMSLLTSGAMTNRIDRVEALGLVSRVPHPVDRRSVIVRLTPQGQELADKAIAAHFEALATTFDTLTATERRDLGRLLGKLLFALEGGPDAATAPSARAGRRGSRER